MSQPTVFLVAWIGYAVIGIGSALFHGTLLYEMQLLDELGMIYTTSIMCYAMFSYERTPAVAALIGVFFLALDIAGTAYYYYSRNPVFHQVSFAIMIISVTMKTIQLCSVKIRPNLDGQSKPTAEQRKRAQKEVDDIVRQLRSMLLSGVGCFLIAFSLWIIDTQFCAGLKSLRRKVGLPWGFLLEFHGYWYGYTFFPTSQQRD